MKRGHLACLAGLAALAALATAPSVHARDAEQQQQKQQSPQGDPELGKTGATPSFSALPEGHVAAPPASQPPARVAAGEKVAGFVTVPPPPEQQKQMARYQREVGFTYVFPNEKRAKEFSRSSSSDEGGDECMADGGNPAQDSRNRGRGFVAEDEDGDGEQSDGAASGWPTNNQSMLSFQFMLKPEPAQAQSEVHAVHSERLVPGADGRATLEMADAWIDSRTRGVRLVGKSTMPLARMFVGPNGLEIYGARDGESLQVVVRTPTMASETPVIAQQLRQRLRNLNAQLPDSSFGSTDCGHMRFVLKAQAGAAQMASIQSIAFLPPLEGDEAKAEPGESPEAGAWRRIQSMRQRAFQLGVSASESSGDKNPIVSISLAWVGRERRGAGF
jgi:hypothetical protein